MLNFSCPDGRRRAARVKPRGRSCCCPPVERPRGFTRAVAILVAGLAGLASAHAATFPVTTTNHTGAGSLRQAILDANALPGPDIISFDIASGGLSIIPTNALPLVTDSVVIDGATQPGFTGTPIVELNGQSAGAGVDGLRISAGNSTIRGLVINRFNGDGIEIVTNGNNIIEGCIIGLNVAGTSDQGNNLNGIFITNAPNNRVGGSAAAQRNVISGNTRQGVLIEGASASGTVIQGNFIGLNASGSAAVGNSQNGLYFFNSPSNTVGGAVAGAWNLIGANSQNGVRIEGSNAFANVVLGNVIGLDVTGTTNRGNGQSGVLLINAPSNTVGGISAEARNLISGNSQAGVRLDGVPARANRVLGNVIGTDVSGVLARGNTGEGVGTANNASGNFIGGTSAGEANLIAFNGGDGVFLPNGTNNVARANAIHSNTGLGIDLGSDGKQANDPGDADSGANNLQNYPVLTAATNTPGGLVVFGLLNSRSNTAYTLDFYSNPLRDPSTNGEGQFYLGSIAVSIGADSNALFNVTLPVQASGRFIAATATDTNGNTSEFSACVRAESTLAPLSLVVTNTDDAGPGSLRQAILNNNLAVTTGRNTIVFAIDGAGPQVISALSQLPSPTEPLLFDGFTQPGASANTLSNGNNAVLKIRLDGASAGSGVDGLRLTSTGLVVRGLSITRFNGDGIEISTNGNSTVEGCFLGLDTDGTNALGNSTQGLLIIGTANNVIGGGAPAQRNVISGNGQNGVLVTGPTATNNFIAGNFIGTDHTGTQDRGNNGDGINLNNAPFNLVGSLVPGTGNLISGNNNDGIDVNTANATNNTVLGNLIGTDVTGTLALGNGQNGVAFNSNARFNRVGVNAGGGANVIAFNGNNGVAAPSNGTNNAIQANRIFSNGALGIDLGNSGVTDNDVGDADSGANQLQNFPVITDGTIHPASITVAGTLNSRPGSDYVLEFFANLTCDLSGHGEGQQHFGSASVTTDGAGNATFNVTLPGVPLGRYLTATATDTNGNTSEFSACFAAASTLPPVTLTVVNTNNVGPGSLRQALLDAGNFPAGSAHLIAFNIPGVGPHTLSPLTQLPTNTEPVILDGYTQPGAATNSLADGFNATLKIRLDGGSFTGFGGAALRLQSGGNTVRGIAFTRWGNRNAVEISNPGGNTVAGCLIGIDTDGSDQHASHGITINGSAGNMIGGLSPGDRNVISYNWTHGIHILAAAASNNVVRGNFIETDLSGTVLRGNAIQGVQIDDAPRNLIGGAEPGARNVISGNSRGVRITSANARGNVIQGNLIGTDATGTVALGNILDGITVESPDTGIGGAQPGAGNVISGNGQFGIDLGPGTTGGVVLGNWIGVGTTGGALSNKVSGVAISGSSNRIGGVLPGEANVIAFNGHAGGVFVAAGTQNAIRGNSIHDNTSAFPPDLGIDHGNDGITANDIGDGDSGPNNRQNFPVVTNAFSGGARTTVQGSLNSAASQTYQLDFFANLACDPSGNGEGQQYLGSASVATDGAGNGSFNVTLPVGAQGRFITATATDAQGNTSEFSPCYEATLSIPPATFTVTTTNDAGPGSLREAVNASNGHVSSQNNTIAFSIPGSGVRVIRLASALPAFLQPVTIDGFTQPGASANTLPDGNNAVHLIEVNGGAVGATGPIQTGLSLNIANLVVRGLRVAAFSRYGIECVSSNGVVAGNLIYSNGFAGLRIPDVSGNLVGGTTPGARNVISANNGGYGIEITGTNAQANQVLGNFIGTDVTGATGWGTQESAVSIWLGSGNQVGGTNAGEGNVMAFHAYTCVHLQSGTNNSVRGNRIFANATLGIDLGNVGLTPNDTGDSDDGANHLQNFPVLTNAVANVGSTVIQGRLNSRPNTLYSLDFYNSAECDFNGYGEGEFYLGTASVTTDGGGNVNFSVTVPAQIQARVITATATDPAGNTSEFSPCLQPGTVNLPGVTYLVTNTNDSGPGSLRQALLDVALLPAAGPDRIHFNIPGAGVKVIQPLTPLPSPAEPFILDGFTQPAAGLRAAGGVGPGGILIQLDGSGLDVAANGSIVRGLSITGCPDDAILLSGDGCTIERCWIGLDPAGLAAGNGGNGCTITGAGNIIVDTVCSANGGNGILLLNPGASNNVIQGNSIGTDASELLALPNPENGILLINAPNNLIGGTAPGAGNVIAGNSENGIRVQGVLCAGNQIQGNYIGTNRDQDPGLGNGRNGVLITGGAYNTIIGGFGETMGNTIANSSLNGVRIDSGNRNGVLGNTFFNTAGKPISVAAGANANVQPPTLDVGYRNASDGITVEGRITGTSNTVYQVQVYQEVSGGPPMVGFPGTAGHTDVFGTIPVTTDQFGNASFSQSFQVALDPNSAGVEATLTCDNNTSEMSAPVLVGDFTDVNLVLSATATDFVPKGSNVFVNINLINRGPADAINATTELQIPPGGLFVGSSNPGGTASVSGQTVIFINQLSQGQTGSMTATFRAPTTPGFLPFHIRTYSPTQNEGDSRDNFTTPRVFVLPGSNATDVAVQISSSANAAEPGQSYIVSIETRNLGSFPAAGVQVQVASGATINAATTTQGTVFPDLRHVYGILGTLDPGQVALITLNVTSDGGFGITDPYTAVVTTTTDDSRPANDVHSLEIPIEPPVLSVVPPGPSDPADNLILQWRDGLGWVLEEASALGTPPPWTQVPEEQIQSVPPNRRHVTTRSEKSRFFRTRRRGPATPICNLHQVAMVGDDFVFPYSG